MDEVINKAIEEMKILVDGKTMYKIEGVIKLNKMGVFLEFTNEGVRYCIR